MSRDRMSITDALGDTIVVEPLNVSGQVHIGIEEGGQPTTLAVWLTPDQAMQVALAIMDLAREGARRRAPGVIARPGGVS